MLFYLFLQAVIYRWQQAVPQGMDVVKNILVFLNFAYTILVLNYSCVGFIVSTLSLSKSHMHAYTWTHAIWRRLHTLTHAFSGTCTWTYSIQMHMYMNTCYFLMLLSCLMHLFCTVQVLSLHETLASYGSVYYIGTILPIVLILLGKIIKPARPVKKARKEEWGS